MTSVYCTAPWNGITVREDGQVKTCCVGQTPLGNLNESSIDEIVNSDVLKEIQQKMLSGQPDVTNCRNCIYSQKQSGFATLQQYYNKTYPTIKPGTLELKCLDIRWNNTCNLGCMYCIPTFSSVWEDRLKVTRTSSVKNYQDELLTWILDKADQVHEIMLVGGEPLLMKQNYSLINRLPDQCRISLITNLSYDLPNLPCTPKLLSRPRENTLWNVSLENTGSQFEYVRNGGSWEQVENNLKYLSDHWPDLVSVNFVYSMFSAFEIVETLKTLHRVGVKKISLIPITGNPTMDIFNMPRPIKAAAAHELKLAQSWHIDQLHPDDKDFYPITGIDTILSRLEVESNSSISQNEFLDKIKWFDQYNDKKFANLWPNVIDLTSKYM